MKKVKCINCGKEYFTEDDDCACFCSSECRYEFETGNSGEEY